MDKDLFLAAHLLRKRANIFSKVGETAAKFTGKLFESGVDSLKVALPLSTLGLAYLIARAKSPEAVADNAHHYAINSILEQSLQQSKDDLAHLLANKSVTRTNRFHDQYL